MTQATTHQQERRQARPRQVAEYLGVSIATVWRWASERHDFPRSRKIGPRVTVWDLNEIDQWVDAQQSNQR
ncbi:AlpA family phage regulatory protein [Stenotrophomonas sp.]|uniref:helix-turn-helix transcriptional regulator n=1 Tax=Stenotrophomonas sp. TaxID=69392 RepID=UPI0025ECF062|nr:AlpA family phage regulatory protein [Stenotrophomonas sp.]MBW8374220.1 AlpA family phage regulatory protein [Stenotrophomonas sp.]MCC5795666.1 AlpA family phage regulatory protein [Chromatiales bacterium]